MEFDLGSNVYTRDGNHVGSVDRIVLNEPDGEVQDIVIHKGSFFSRDVLIPLAQVSAVDNAGVHLQLDEHQLDLLPDFIETEYAYPNPSVVPMYTIGTVMFPLGTEPGVAPLIVGERKHLPEGTADVAQGYTVCAADGTQIGVVRDIRVDSDLGTIDFLTIDGLDDDRGPLRVSASLIGGVSDEVVTLTVSSDALRALRSSI